MPRKTMKKIAFLSFDWDYEIISEYYLGIQDYLRGREGVQVVIFSAFGHYYASHEPEPSTFEVFKLCDPRRYDGFLVQGNRTWPPELRQRFVTKAVTLGKPVVSINYDLDGAHTVGTDNYHAMYGLIDKVLSDRGSKRTLFINGLQTSVEAQARAQAYRDACVSHGVEHPDFRQANWQIEEGVAAARDLLQGEDLPEVVFCCNDDLAVGLQETLQEAGVLVPEDVMVSGFDNREISLRTTPHVTTVNRDYRTIGGTAMDAILRLIAGEDLPPFVASPARNVLTASCGYDEEATGIGDLYSIDNSLKHFYEVLGYFQSMVLGADSLYEIMCHCEHYAHDMRCANAYLTIDDRFLIYDVGKAGTSYGPIAHLMAHYGTQRLDPFDEDHDYATFLTKDILPPKVPMDQPVYVVYPLRQNKTCIGTLVTDGVSPIVMHGFLTFFLTLLSGSIENVRKKEMLQAANSRLDDLYVHDELTGLFNRFGLDRFGTIAYEHLLRDHGEAQFIFVDVDDMKDINDTCGHEMGDRALRQTADIIRRSIRDEDAFAMRYGGDEFLLISRRDLTPRIEHELSLFTGGFSLPYQLSLSVGATKVRADEGLAMEDAIDRADVKMYQIKKAHKSASA